MMRRRRPTSVSKRSGEQSQASIHPSSSTYRQVSAPSELGIGNWESGIASTTSSSCSSRRGMKMTRPNISACLLILAVCGPIKALPVGHGTTWTADSFGDSNVVANICKDMAPFHVDSSGAPHRPQNVEAPYRIETSVKKIKPRDKVKLTISGVEGATLRGFMTQARHGNRAYGKFERNQNTGLIDCFGEKENTATTTVHVDKTDKNGVSVTWLAPNDLPEYIEFVVTIVKDYSTFWVGLKSEKLYSVKEGSKEKISENPIQSSPQNPKKDG